MSMANQTTEESAIKREYLFAKEVEKLFGISHKTVLRWKDERKVSHTKLGSRVLFLRSEFEEMIRQNVVLAIDKHEKIV